MVKLARRGAWSQSDDGAARVPQCRMDRETAIRFTISTINDVTSE